jgi:hypothetical protein
MNWEGFRRKKSWPNLRYYPGICLKELRKTMKGFSQDSKFLGRDLNGGPPEYEECLKDYDVQSVFLKYGKLWKKSGRKCVPIMSCDINISSLNESLQK